MMGRRAQEEDTVAQLQDIPRLIGEFVAMARDYVVQETMGAARKLGRFAGFSLGAGVLWAIATLLLAVAGVRTLIDILPESPYWEALGYFLFAILLVILVAIIVRIVPDRRIAPPSKEHLP
jgi:membrane protein DedA with SNARE-associated domain